MNELASHSAAYKWWANVELDRVLFMIRRHIISIDIPIQSILHIGAGEGRRMDYWLDHFPEAEHTGVDLDFSRLAHLSLGNKVNANGRALPFENDQFDLVIGIATFHHFDNPRLGMIECLRVGKTLVFMEPLQSRTVNLLMRVGVIAEYEAGEKIHRLNLDRLRTNWFDSRVYRVNQLTYLHKHVAAIYLLLERTNARLSVYFLRLLYQILNGLLFPLHTKCVVVISKS